MRAQTESILLHLLNFGSITPIEAYDFFGFMRLAARINDLRNQGHEIQTVIIHKNGKRYASYRLIKLAKKAAA